MDLAGTLLGIIEKSPKSLFILAGICASQMWGIEYLEKLSPGLEAKHNTWLVFFCASIGGVLGGAIFFILNQVRALFSFFCRLGGYIFCDYLDKVSHKKKSAQEIARLLADMEIKWQHFRPHEKSDIIYLVDNGEYRYERHRAQDIKNKYAQWFETVSTLSNRDEIIRPIQELVEFLNKKQKAQFDKDYLYFVSNHQSQYILSLLDENCTNSVECIHELAEDVSELSTIKIVSDIRNRRLEFISNYVRTLYEEKFDKKYLPYRNL